MSETDRGRAGDLDRSPGVASAATSVVAALLAVALLGGGAALFVAVPGAVLLGAGATLGRRGLVNYGAVGLLAGVAVVGVNGGPPELLVPCTLAVLLAWDLGGYGITVGAQLGRDADTTRAELVHGAASVAVGAAGGAVGYGVYRAVAGETSVAALALLLGGAAVLVASFQR